MLNDSHPLISALKQKGPKVSDGSVKMPEIPRTFQLHKHEFPGLTNVHPGQSITAHLHGHVSSVHEDGRIMMDVHGVKPDSDALDKKEYPGSTTTKSQVVRTHESHAG